MLNTIIINIALRDQLVLLVSFQFLFQVGHFLAKIYLFETGLYIWWVKDIFYLLINSSNGSHGWRWASLKPAPRTPELVPVSHVVADAQGLGVSSATFQSYQQRAEPKVEQPESELMLIQDDSAASGGLVCYTMALAPSQHSQCLKCLFPGFHLQDNLGLYYVNAETHNDSMVDVSSFFFLRVSSSVRVTMPGAIGWALVYPYFSDGPWTSNYLGPFFL